ncbi:MAG: GNAT family N-acetyltransferase [Spirochaetes bacterium]|nr:GNAT family N-acetyltransferase [Spirochaetota bacterium]MBN2772387.1 GNAT family N-acetyltransferase [Spirochaetota bacterium]
MKNDYAIRLARKEDISNIMEIERLSFALEICEDEDVFLTRLNVFSDGFYVLEHNSRIAGYFCSEIWKFIKEPTPQRFIPGHSICDYHDVRGSELYISSMGLHPDYRGAGMGRYMFEQALDNVNKKHEYLKTGILIVSEKWEKAIQIYKKYGFQELFAVNNFFEYKGKQAEKGIVMRCYIKTRESNQ